MEDNFEIKNQIIANNLEKNEDFKSLDIDNKLIILLLEKYNIDPFSNMTVKDVAKDLGMNQNSANELFRRKDFPSINFTKPKQVCTLSYYLWKMKGGNLNG